MIVTEIQEERSDVSSIEPTVQLEALFALGIAATNAESTRDEIRSGVNIWGALRTTNRRDKFGKNVARNGLVELLRRWCFLLYDIAVACRKHMSRHNDAWHCLMLVYG